MTTPPRVRRAALVGATVLVATAGPGIAQTPTPPASPYRLVYSAESTSDLFITDTVNPAVAITSGPTRDLAPDWSADGATIAFQRVNTKGTDSDIWLVAPDGTNPRQITHGRAFDRSPAWSPDGTRIAFSRRLKNQSSHIWVMNADGSGLKQLTKGWTGESTPAWSPDGTRIAYSRQSGARPNSDLWIMRANGAGAKKLVATPAFEGEPSFTPDGTRIVFSRESGKIPRKPAPLWQPKRYNLDIWSVAVNGTGRTRLFTRPGDDYGPNVSPDGTRYVFQEELNCPGSGCNTELFIGYLDGVTPPVQVTNRVGLDWDADWGPAAPAATEPTLPAPPAPPA